MADTRQVLSILAMICLLFFGIPIRVDKSNDNKNEKSVHEKLFLSYVNKFNKAYRHNETEYKTRFEAFKKSLELIDLLNHNRTCNSSALYGLTEYSDLHYDEFSKKHLRMKTRKYVQFSKHVRSKRALVQQAIDWRTKGVITPVYSQKLCGACWAFSTIETLESMQAIKTGKLEQLSVQEAIDCSRNDNDGCAGGDICSLLQWMWMTKTKIQPASQYPLKWQTGVCLLTDSNNIGVGIADFSCNTYVANEKLILDILANHGPVAVAVNALTWQNYLGGVIQYHCDNSLDMLNHAAQIVGYNLTAEIPYYLVRNSWGTSFGEKGYLKIAIGGNICGLAHEVATIFV